MRTTHEEPHAGAQASCSDAVQERHMGPEAGRQSLERLRGHRVGVSVFKKGGLSRGR